MAIKMANMCARVTSTYMEFTLTFGSKLEFKNTFKFYMTGIDFCINICYDWVNTCSIFEKTEDIYENNTLR